MRRGLGRACGRSFPHIVGGLIRSRAIVLVIPVFSKGIVEKSWSRPDASIRLRTHGFDVEKSFPAAAGSFGFGGKSPWDWKRDRLPRGIPGPGPPTPRRSKASPRLRRPNPNHSQPTFHRSPPKPTISRRSRRRSTTRLRSAAACGSPICSSSSISRSPPVR